MLVGMCGAENSHHMRHGIVKELFISTEVMFTASIQARAPDVLCAIAPGGKDRRKYVQTLSQMDAEHLQQSSN